METLTVKVRRDERGRFARKSRVVTEFKQGHFYKQIGDLEIYICARIGYANFKLISLKSGNRWSDGKNPATLEDRFIELPNAKIVVKEN